MKKILLLVIAIVGSCSLSALSAQSKNNFTVIEFVFPEAGSGEYGIEIMGQPIMDVGFSDIIAQRFEWSDRDKICKYYVRLKKDESLQLVSSWYSENGNFDVGSKPIDDFSYCDINAGISSLTSVSVNGEYLSNSGMFGYICTPPNKYVFEVVY